jgi:3'(2'), 5'-bisphosphate nucleotidase
MSDELLVMKQAVRDAATLVMGIYAGDFAVEYKGKNDPVTLADKQANALIVERLAAAFPTHGILAEESPPESALELAGAQAKDHLFCVDPIDGTREFVDKNGEFCVMLGLARGTEAILGVVAVPAEAKLFFGGPGLGTFVEPLAGGEVRRLELAPRAEGASLRALVSRSHTSPRTKALLDRLAITEQIRCGSVGVKATRILEGVADLYVHPSRGCKLWDACAPDALVRGAGGVLVDLAGRPIDYRGSLDVESGLIATHTDLLERIVAAANDLPS